MAVGKGWRGGKGVGAGAVDVTLALGAVGTAGATGGKGRRT
jgi:hypothetical protein